MIIVDNNIKKIFRILIFPAVISSNNRVKFKNGTSDNKVDEEISSINAIIPGKKAINVNGVNELCASLNVLDLLAIAIHNPLIKNE